VTTLHVADTGLVVALGQPSDERYRAVERFARQNEVSFTLPRRVYDELTEPTETTRPPVDTAVADGWICVADPLAYHVSLVSRVMDGVQRYVANADGRPADEVERADAALAGVVAHGFAVDDVEAAYVYTTDVAAGRGVETVFTDEGYGDSVVFVDGFRFVEDLR
jgi:hypothetical protein